MWDECVWKITFLLLDKLLPHMHGNPRNTPFVDVTATAADVNKLALDSSSWDESNTIIDRDDAE